MNTLKKTMFLTNNNNSLFILTLEKKNNNIFGTIKSYDNKLTGDLILGIKCNEKIFKQNITFENNPFNFIISEKISLDDNINCVLLKNENNSFSTIAWGKEKSDDYKIKIINNLKQSISKISNITPSKITSTTNNQPKADLSDDIDENVTEKIINKPTPIDIIKPKENNTTNEENSSTTNNDTLIEEKSEIAVCSSELFESSDEEIEEIIDEQINNDTTEKINTNQENKKFYNMISSQIDELFDRYPREYNLEKLIDNSNWVKINFDNDDKYYVVGLIFEEDNQNIKYVCYGVPGEFNQSPPRELRGYSQWLPTDVTNPYTNGYWVMYQDAETGENILID